MSQFCQPSEKREYEGRYERMTGLRNDSEEELFGEVLIPT